MSRLLSITALGLMPPKVVARGLPTPAAKPKLNRADQLTEEEKERKAVKLAEIRRERLQKQKALEEEEKAAAAAPKKEVQVDADLRAQYYYPTARKRYLPRIKKAYESFPAAKNSLKTGDWASIEEFATTTADNAALPLKLYASSLQGQGLSLNLGYVATLEEQGSVYAERLDSFKKAVRSRSSAKAMESLTGMENAMMAYRKAARIDTADGGVGELPTDRYTGASFSNNSPLLYQKE